MSSMVQITEIFHVDVTQSDTISAGFRAPFFNADAQIKVWRGLSVPYDDISSFIVDVNLGDQVSSDGTLIQLDGEDFETGEYTIGYCANPYSESVCASVSLLDGQPAQQRANYFFLTAQYADMVELFYMALPGCNPQADNHQVMICASDLQYNWWDATIVATAPVTSEDDAGMMQLKFDPGTLVTGKSYTLYYQAKNGIVAGYQFYYFA